MTPCSHVNSLILQPLIKLARLGSYKNDFTPMWGAITFPALHDVISSALQTTSCIFFSSSSNFLSKQAEPELAQHESSTQDECLALRNICSVFISRRITSIMHHKHIIGSSWGKFPTFWGNSTVLPGEPGKSVVCVCRSST